MKNPRTQFEIRSKRDLINEFRWCIDNLPLKEDRGIVYQFNEIYFITSSEKIIHNVNKHFGSSFIFGKDLNDRIFYLP